MSTLRIALAQILSVADPEENLELVATRTAEAARQEAQLVVFPEATMRRFGLPLAEIAGLRPDLSAGRKISQIDPAGCMTKI